MVAVAVAVVVVVVVVGLEDSPGEAGDTPGHHQDTLADTSAVVIGADMTG